MIKLINNNNTDNDNNYENGKSDNSGMLIKPLAE